MRNPFPAGTVEACDFREEMGEDMRERQIQREIDEEREVQLALFEGREAGRLQLAAGLNRYEMGTPQAKAWERGRSEVEAQRRIAELKRAAKPSNPAQRRDAA